MSKFALLCSLAFLSPAVLYGVELEQATNPQLLRELGRRLQGGPAPIGPSATALYTCDSSGHLTATLTGGARPQTRNVYAGSYQGCIDQTSSLNAHKRVIAVPTTVAVCDSSGHLYQYTFSPSATITDIGSTYTGSFKGCLLQAAQINSGPR